MKLAIKWCMSVYLNQKMATFGMTMIYYFLTFQPTNLNDILIYDKLYSAQSTSISCLHLKPTLLLSYHLFCCYSERWRTMLHVLSQNLTLTSSKMTSVMPELTESRAGCLHSIWNIHSFIEFPWSTRISGRSRSLNSRPCGQLLIVAHCLKAADILLRKKYYLK